MKPRTIQPTSLLRKLSQDEKYTIIGDYYYHLLDGDDITPYPFQGDDDNEMMKLKATLSLKERILFDLQLTLLDETLSDLEKETIELDHVFIRDFISEIVAAEKPEVLDKTFESYSLNRHGYNLTLFIERFDVSDVCFLLSSDDDNPLAQEWSEKRDIQNKNTLEGVDWDPELAQRLELLGSIIFDNIAHQAERAKIMEQMSRVALESSFVKNALERCLFVKVKFEDWLRLVGRARFPAKEPLTKTKKNRSKKKGFTTPGETLEGNTKVSIHAMRQMFTPKHSPKTTPGQIAIDWGNKTGLPINSEIDRYGLDLTTTQYKVMEGILRAFSETQYKGNLPTVTVSETLQEQNIRVRSKSDVPGIFKNLVEIPRIQISQRDLLRLSGIDENNKSEMIDGLEALGYLSVTQFCFYYTRLAVSETGAPEKNPKSGDFKKEEVQAIDKLFTVKRVSDDVTKEFKYYEIMPSPIFLDQVDRYFLLVPRGWMEEVKGKVGLKRASSYTFRFLLYLRFQFEEKRRKIRYQKSNCRYEIKSTWQQIAKDLKMPESVYIRQKKRALALLGDAYSTALQLGYLTSHDREGDIDILVLNEEKYPAPKEE